MTSSANRKPIPSENNPVETLQKKLLVVDSEQNLPAFLDDAFNQDFQIDLAFDGPAALIKIRRQTPDIVLVDVSEPEVRGYELIRFLLDEDATKGIPIIAIGREGFDPAIEKSVQSEKSVRAYFRKPFIYKERKSEIEKILKGERAAQLAARRMEPVPAAAPILPQLVQSAVVPAPAKTVQQEAKKTSSIGRTFLRWMFLLLGVAAGLIALVEGGWRLAEIQNNQQVFDPQFLESRWGGVPIQTPSSISWEQAGKSYALNNFGLRGPNLDLIKPADTYRVLVLGGVDVFGENISQAELLTARLQERLQKSQPFWGLSRYEVLNGGFWGLSTEEQWAYFERTVAQLHPDMVIWLWDTEGAVPYNGERLKIWSRLPAPLQGLFSHFHILRTVRQRYWRGGAPPVPANYPLLVKRARAFMNENGGILVIGAPISIPINFPTEPEYHEVRQKYFFFSTGERPSNGSQLVWSAQDHASFAAMIEKYILLAYPGSVRNRTQLSS